MTLNEAFELMNRDPIKAPEKVTVRPIRPRFIGPCKTCGDNYFGCPCEEEK